MAVKAKKKVSNATIDIRKNSDKISRVYFCAAICMKMFSKKKVLNFLRNEAKPTRNRRADNAAISRISGISGNI